MQTSELLVPNAAQLKRSVIINTNCVSKATKTFVMTKRAPALDSSSIQLAGGCPCLVPFLWAPHSSNFDQ